MKTHHRHLGSWGRLPRPRSFILDPASEAELLERLATDPVPLIARGLGRSYGDACTGDRLLLTRCLNAPLRLDSASGVLSAGAGHSLGEILNQTLPQGWAPAVLPGTRHVTLGGAVSADVHGKNHHVDGSFCRWVQALRVAAPDGTAGWCSREENPGQFSACCGGMGLAGLILEVRLQLVRRDTVTFQRLTLACENLEQALLRLREATQSHTVAWVDAASPGAKLGRCLVYLGDPVAGPHRELPRPARLKLPPLSFFNLVRPAASRAFNQLVWRGGQRRHGVADLQALDSFFWPLDAVDGWNHLYGHAGFLQFQCLLPVALLDERGAGPLHQLLELFATVGGGTLAVMKTMGEAGRDVSPLAFPGPGATLALDLPASAETRKAVRQANRLVLDWGGRIYLAKDALLSAAEYRAMTPGLAGWQELRDTLDPQRRWQSDLARRLEL
ncbi:MAG: FAD-binding oxidoreductase [Candidatus Delongbacteria bacterium]